MKDETFPGFPREELIWWEMNILWSLNQYENPSRLLNILDIVAALLAFKQSAPKYVEHILLKWLAPCLGSKSENFPTLLPEAFKFLPKFSSRQLHLINIVSRRLVLKEFIIENVSGKELVLAGLSDDKTGHINLWMELLLSCENGLLERLVGISFSAVLSLPSNSSEVFFQIGDWSPDGLPHMEQWVQSYVIFLLLFVMNSILTDLDERDDCFGDLFHNGMQEGDDGMGFETKAGTAENRHKGKIEPLTLGFNSIVEFLQEKFSQLDPWGQGSNKGGSIVVNPNVVNHGRKEEGSNELLMEAGRGITDGGESEIEERSSEKVNVAAVEMGEVQDPIFNN